MTRKKLPTEPSLYLLVLNKPIIHKNRKKTSGQPSRRVRMRNPLIDQRLRHNSFACNLWIYPLDERATIWRIPLKMN